MPNTRGTRISGNGIPNNARNAVSRAMFMPRAGSNRAETRHASSDTVARTCSVSRTVRR